MRKFKGAEVGPVNMRLKLILMSVAAFAITCVVVYLVVTASGDMEPNGDVSEYGAELEYVLPTAPPGTFEGIDDATEHQRIYIEDAQLEVVRAVVRSTTAMGIAATGVRTLDAPTVAELFADPDAARGTYFTVRGEILQIARRATSPGGDREEYVGALRTDEGSTVFFRALRADDEGLRPGDWARVDGVFFKILRDEVPVGDEAGTEEFAEGPLLVGPQILQSFPDFGSVTSVEPEHWDRVRDDTLTRRVGPQDAMLWRLLAWMREVPTGGAHMVPGVAKGGELDEKLLLQMRDYGASYRGQVFTLPVSRVQIVTVRTAGENPARLTHYTEAWLGNSLWQKQPVIRVLMPGVTEEFKPGTLVTAELVYYMNVAYETRTNLSLAPLFVAQELRVFEPPRETVLRTLLYGFVAFLTGMGILMAFLVRRDQRQSKELADKLVQRRRERRAKSGMGT